MSLGLVVLEKKLPMLQSDDESADIINILNSAEALADNRNVHFRKLSHIDVETVDKVRVLEALHVETSWTVVTDKCCCTSIVVKCSTKCHVGSYFCQNLMGQNTVLCTIVAG